MVMNRKTRSFMERFGLYSNLQKNAVVELLVSKYKNSQGIIFLIVSLSVENIPIHWKYIIVIITPN